MRKLLVTSLLLSGVIFIAYLTSVSDNSEIKKKPFGRVELKALKSVTPLNESLEEEKDRPDLAAAQDFAMTKDPALGYPPVERKLIAYDLIQKKFKQQSQLQTAIQGVDWTSRGPNNISGRVRALMFDPNDANNKRVFAGSISGGLWSNEDITNADAQWQPVNDLMSNLAISSIAYDPSNTQVFYMGTGLGFNAGDSPRGEGIWKSTDGGVNWDQLGSTGNENFHYVLKIAVTNLGTVLATTSEGIFRSTNNGTSWIRLIEGHFSDIEISSDNSIYVSKGIFSNGSMFKSMDDGVSWNDITPSDSKGGQRIEIASAPSDPDVVYAIASTQPSTTNDVAWFRKSEDAGETWTDIEIPLLLDFNCTLSSAHFTRQQAWLDLILAVSPDNPDIIIAGGIDLHKSINGGSDWTPISYWLDGFCPEYDNVHADQHEIKFRPGHSDEAIFGNDGGVFYSPDVGDFGDPSFEPRVKGLVTTQFYSVAMREEFNSNFYLGGTQDNGTILFNTPGMNNGTQFSGGDGINTFIDKDNPDVIISSTAYNQIWLSQDGGLNLNFIINDPDRGMFVNAAEYDQNAKILYTAGNNNELVRVSDITTTLSSPAFVSVKLGGRQISSIKASPYTKHRLFVGVEAFLNESHIFMIDSAHLAVPIVKDISGTFGGAIGSFVSSIDIGETDDQIMLTFSNYGVHSVFETSNGGVNWINKEGNLPDIPVRWSIYNPNNRKQVLLATELGVWSTNNFGTTPNWAPTNNGLANVRTTMIRYRAVDQQIAVASYGRGIFTSNVFATTTDANFKVESSVGYVGHPVQFSDASILANDDWSWDFGDGGTATSQNPIHTFETPGVYDVSLSVSSGSDTETKPSYITILPFKSTPYLAADGGDFESNPTDFASKALKGGINVWEKGVPGNFLASPESGTDAWKTILDSDLTDLGFNYASALYSPAFDFSDDSRDYKIKFLMGMESLFCNAPYALQIQYSTDLGVTWKRLGDSFFDFGATNWYFRTPDLGCQISAGIFPDYTGWAGGSFENETSEYPLNFLAGEETVSFRYVVGAETGYTSGYDSDGFMIENFEIITSLPTAEFTAELLNTYTGVAIDFTYESNGATSFLWDFGNGSTSTDQNPSTIFENAGSYDITLTVQTSGGEIVETKPKYIRVLPRIIGAFSPEDGGNFETNTSYFAAHNMSHTPFELGNSSVSGKDGTASGNNAWVTDLDAIEYLNDSEAHLYTPAFSFNLVGEYILEFKAKYKFEANWDGFIVEYSTDLGNTWTKLNDTRATGWYNSTSDVQNQIFGATTPIFSGNHGSSFETYATDVSSLYPNNNVSFRFVFRTDAAEIDVGLAIDDFQLIAPTPGPAVPEFSALGITGCSGQQVIFTNLSTGSFTSMSWDFGDNASPATATGVGPHSVRYEGEGLSTVALTLNGLINGIVVEEKFDFIATAAKHTPSFTEENNGDRNIARLVASAGDAYQWLLNEVEIEGATNQVYLADKIGAYSVKVTVNGCAVTSTKLRIVTEVASDPEFTESIFTYPNPVNDILNVKVSNQNIGKMTLTIYDNTGKKISQKQVDKNQFEAEYKLNLGQLESNMYLLEIILGDSRGVKRIIKQ